MILLDTNALIWLDQGHARVRPLLRGGRRLYISPATVLELQFLAEAGRIRLRSNDVTSIANDERWAIDEPASAAWFAEAAQLGWTRDPFDRLIAAHAVVRGWTLATGDQAMLQHLGPRRSVEL